MSFEGVRITGSFRIVRNAQLPLVACVEIATTLELKQRTEIYVRQRNEGLKEVEIIVEKRDIVVIRSLKISGVKKFSKVRHVLVAGLLLIAVAVFPARATIGTALQMQLGNPSNATSNTNNHDHFLIQRTVQALDYNDNLREPNWASWDLTTDDVGSSGRSSFLQDTTLPGNFYWVKATDYSGSGYDRGHMCPSGDRTISTAVNDLVFYMSNIIPQTPDNNQGVWANLETYCRTLASAGNELLIICGPEGFGTNQINAAGLVYIPSNVWKIVVVVTNGTGTAVSRINTSTRVIAVNIPNIAGIRTTPWTNYLVSVNQLQTNTGYNFFTALPSYTAAVLRAKIDGQPIPVISPPIFGGLTNNHSLALSWPSAASGFFLQQNVSLNPTNWTTYGGTITTNGDTLTAVIPASSGNNFFRLKHP